MQCGTCTAVCPLIEYMEYSPRVLNALLLAGSYDDVLRSRAIWVCASCYACTVACPKQFPITDSIYALKRAAMRSGVYPRRFPTPVMTRRFVGMVGRRGRSSEFWISMSLYLRTQPAKLLRQAPMALGLLRRGRLRVRAESLSPAGAAPGHAQEPGDTGGGARMSYAYYPGCSANGTGRPYDKSLHAVLGALGSGLEGIDDWNCCGSSAYSGVDTAKAVALSARNLALAERARPGEGPVDVVAPCSGCYRALLKSERALAAGGPVAERVRAAFPRLLGWSFEGRARTRHPIDVLVNDIGLERIAAATVRPLRGLRVACYYGCLLVRPYATFDDQRQPTSMERLMRAIGAEPVEWPLKTRCCGGSCYCGGPVIGPIPDATLRLSFQLLKDAKRCGAEMIVTACIALPVQPRGVPGSDGADLQGVRRRHRGVLHPAARSRPRAGRARAGHPADAALAAAGADQRGGGGPCPGLTATARRRRRRRESASTSATAG